MTTELTETLKNANLEVLFSDLKNKNGKLNPNL